MSPSTPMRWACALLLTSAGAALLGCGEGIEDTTTDPDSTGIVSNALRIPGAPGSETVAYIHLTEGTAPNGIAARIENRNLGITQLAYPVGGGFDPVAVLARPGDLLDIEVRQEDGGVIYHAEMPVPRSGRPIIVRTNPPPRKRDVPLNAYFVIVFSEPIESSSLRSGTVRLVADDGVVTGQVQLGADGLRAEFVPDRVLTPNTEYQLVVSSEVTDLEGDPLQPQELEFTTGTAVEPTGMSQIAFGTCLDDERCGIYVMNADGSGVRQLTDPATSRNLDPAWSPDGQKIAFSGFQHCVYGVPGMCFNEIFVMNADGSGVVRLTSREGAGSVLPSWSPDGQKIAFQSYVIGGAVDIYVMNADGSNPVRLTSDPGFAMAPRWSPDGTRIAFISSRDGDEEIYVMNADGSTPTRLTNNPGLDQFPDWSPDGLRIAFTSDRDLDSQTDGRDIWVMNTDGSNPIRLTDHPAYDNAPAWAPDGSRIAFASGRDGSGLFVMNADGSAVRLLRAGFAGPPSWSRIGTVPPPSGPASRTINR